MKRLTREHGLLSVKSKQSGRRKYFAKRKDAASFLKRLRRRFPKWRL